MIHNRIATHDRIPTHNPRPNRDADRYYDLNLTLNVTLSTCLNITLIDTIKESFCDGQLFTRSAADTKVQSLMMSHFPNYLALPQARTPSPYPDCPSLGCSPDWHSTQPGFSF